MNVVGSCGSGTSNPAPNINCPGGYNSVGVRSMYCGCSAVQGCSASSGTGQQMVRTCASTSNSIRVEALFSRSNCYGVVRQGMQQTNFNQNGWCNGAAGRNTEGQCWLPYLVDGDLNCFPMDFAGVGQFSASGTVTTAGPEYKISTATQSTLSVANPNIPGVGGVNKGKIAAVAGGGSVGAAAVIGLALFNRKRNLKTSGDKAHLVELKGGSQV
jgi:hypothetical protein